MEHPKGHRRPTTLAVITALNALGYPILLPFGENTRYDLVIDEGKRLARVQCKSGRLQHGAVLFKACSIYAHHPNPKVTFRPYHGEIDYFAVYCSARSGVYLVPIAHVPNSHQVSLRVDPARNNQQLGVRLAARYEIAKVKVRPTAGLRASSGAG
jgi:PD-(D/E)XK endonuclease